MKSRALRTVGVLLVAAAVPACATARAERAEPPALLVPTPDPVMLIPASLPSAPEPATVTTETATEDAPASRPARTPPRPAGAAAPEPSVADVPAAAPPVVLTTGNAQELAIRARQDLDTAQQHLSRVVYSQLGRDGRAQYDEVRRFIRLAEEKLETRNYVYANELAERAALLASLLGN